MPGPAAHSTSRRCWRWMGLLSLPTCKSLLPVVESLPGPRSKRCCIRSAKPSAQQNPSEERHRTPARLKLLCACLLARAHQVGRTKRKSRVRLFLRPLRGRQRRLVRTNLTHAYAYASRLMLFMQQSCVLSCSNGRGQVGKSFGQMSM